MAPSPPLASPLRDTLLLPPFLLPVLSLNGLIQSLLSPYLSYLLMTPSSPLCVGGRLLSAVFSLMYLPYCCKILFGAAVSSLERRELLSRRGLLSAPSSPRPCVVLKLLLLTSLLQPLSFVLSLLLLPPYFSPSPPPAGNGLAALLAISLLRNLCCALADYLASILQLRLARHSSPSPSLSLPALTAQAAQQRWVGSLAAAAALAGMALLDPGRGAFTPAYYSLACALCLLLSLRAAAGVWGAYRDFAGRVEGSGEGFEGEEYWPCFLPAPPGAPLLPPPDVPGSSPGGRGSLLLGLPPSDLLFAASLQAFLAYLTFSPSFASPLKSGLCYAAALLLLCYPLWNALGGGGKGGRSVFARAPPALLYLVLRLALPNITYTQVRARATRQREPSAFPQGIPSPDANPRPSPR